MTITTEEYVSVPVHARDLGFGLPAGLVILPENFGLAIAGDDLRFRSEAATVGKLLRAGGLEVGRLAAGQDRTMFVHNRSYDWAVPAIFIGSEILKTNPDVVSVVIDLVRDHVKELFGGPGSKRRVSLEIVVENERGRCRKVKYEGGVEGLKDVDRIVKSLR